MLKQYRPKALIEYQEKTITEYRKVIENTGRKNELLSNRAISFILQKIAEAYELRK